MHSLSYGVLALTVDAALPKIQSVTVTPSFVGTSPNANPSLEVSWTAVDDPAVSYVVRYSRSAGTVTVLPDGAGQMSVNGKMSRSLLTLLLTRRAFTPTTFGWLLCLQESLWWSTVTEQVEGHWTVKWVHDTRACISLYVYALWSCLHVNWVMKLCFFYFAPLYVLFCIWVNLFWTFL